MVKQQTKFSCALICMVFGFVAFIRKDYISSSILLLMLVYWIYSLFSYSKVFTAFELIKKRDYPGAKELLTSIKKPANLSKREKGYFFMCKGILATAESNFDEAEDSFITALLYEKFFRDSSIVYLNLAQIALVKKNYEAARTFLEESKKSPREKKIADYHEKIESMIMWYHRRENYKKFNDK